MLSGWICPRCGASNAPSVARCACSSLSIYPTGGFLCTCGRYVSFGETHFCTWPPPNTPLPWYTTWSTVPG